MNPAAADAVAIALSLAAAMVAIAIAAKKMSLPPNVDFTVRVRSLDTEMTQFSTDLCIPDPPSGGCNGGEVFLVLFSCAKKAVSSLKNLVTGCCPAAADIEAAAAAVETAGNNVKQKEEDENRSESAMRTEESTTRSSETTSTSSSSSQSHSSSSASSSLSSQYMVYATAGANANGLNRISRVLGSYAGPSNVVPVPLSLQSTVFVALINDTVFERFDRLGRTLNSNVRVLGRGCKPKNWRC